jgi:predicted glycogen debranching enzyme
LPDRQKHVVDVCARHLLTSFGLRSLAPGHPDYRGRYGGDQRSRDGAYHRGTAWGWLLGPFTPNGCIAQAWSVAETLRAWHELARE